VGKRARVVVAIRWEKKSGASGEKGGVLTRKRPPPLECGMSASACLPCLVLLVLWAGRRVLSTWSQMCFVHLVLGLGLNCCLIVTPVVIQFELSDRSLGILFLDIVDVALLFAFGEFFLSGSILSVTVLCGFQASEHFTLCYRE
jgi:hypothetical protein